MLEGHRGYIHMLSEVGKREKGSHQWLRGWRAACIEQFPKQQMVSREKQQKHTSHKTGGPESLARFLETS